MSEPEKQITPVPQNKSFARNVKKQKIVSYIVAELKKIDSLDHNDVALLLRTCEIIENKCRKKYKLNKFDVLQTVYKQLFPTLKDNEFKRIEDNVNSLLINGQVIKYSRAYKFFTTKLLPAIQKIFL